MNQYNREAISWQTVCLLLIGITSVFLLRSLWTYPTQHSDAVQKFFYAAEILRSNDWNLLLHNHHTLRWAAMLPQTALTWLLDGRYEAFFIMPLLMFSLYVTLIVFSLRNVLSFSQQVLLGVLLFSEPMALHTSNQYSIVGVGVFSTFAGVMILVKQSERPNLAAILAATMFFIAYGAHVTYLSFAAGGFLWLTLCQRKLSRTVIFCASLLVLMMMETLFFNYLSDWQLTFGRLEALADGSHVALSLTFGPVTSDQLLTRWLVLPLPHLLLCLLFLIAGPWLIMQRKKGMQIPALIECTFLVGLCFAVATTFAVTSIDPLKLVIPPNTRYLVPFFPFASIIVFYMLSISVARVLGKGHPRLVVVASLCLSLFLVIWPTYKIDFFRSKFDAFMWVAEEEYSGYSDRFQRGELILTGQKKVVNSLIAGFRNPVDVIQQETLISARKPTSGAKCVARLDKNPLYLNYQDCTYQE